MPLTLAPQNAQASGDKMGPLGFQEILLIVAIILVILGPKRLPETARQVGRTLSKFKRAADDAKSVITGAISSIDINNLEDTKKPQDPSKANSQE